MATAVSVPFVPVATYLQSAYRPDVDYLDGILEERNVGEFDHGDLQWAVMEAINAFTQRTGVRARPEIRVQISATRYRVPDVCVVGRGWKREQIVTNPLLCVEILSPRDTLQQMADRCRDYLKVGVPEAWILDPRRRQTYVVDGESASVYHQQEIPILGTEIEVNLPSIFAVLDR